MQYYELTIQKNSDRIDIRDYYKYIDRIRDLWEITIIPMFEYGSKRGRLHVHCLCVRDPDFHPLRRANIPIKPGYSISFARCRSRFAWEQYYAKHITEQADIIEYELLRKYKNFNLFLN